MPTLPFKISVLVFIQNKDGELLLIHRKKKPNFGCWSAIGGKLEMDIGESPYECAIRETYEETAFRITEKDLHLFAMIAEKGYECTGHWLLFLYHCRRPIEKCPPSIEEGDFSFFSFDTIHTLNIPQTDRKILWPVYQKYRDLFISMRIDCKNEDALETTIEEAQGIDVSSEILFSN